MGTGGRVLACRREPRAAGLGGRGGGGGRDGGVVGVAALRVSDDEPVPDGDRRVLLSDPAAVAARDGSAALPGVAAGVLVSAEYRAARRRGIPQRPAHTGHRRSCRSAADLVGHDPGQRRSSRAAAVLRSDSTAAAVVGSTHGSRRLDAVVRARDARSDSAAARRTGVVVAGDVRYPRGLDRHLARERPAAGRAAHLDHALPIRDVRARGDQLLVRERCRHA